MKKISIIISLLLCALIFTSCASQEAGNTAEISIYIEDEDRFVLKETTIEAKDGATVLDVLKDVVKENKIHIEYEGSYVKGIDNLYAQDKGEMSGWLFYVNGESATKGADSVYVRDGDKIEWIYITEFNLD